MNTILSLYLFGLMCWDAFLIIGFIDNDLISLSGKKKISLYFFLQLIWPLILLYELGKIVGKMFNCLKDKNDKASARES